MCSHKGKVLQSHFKPFRHADKNESVLDKKEGLKTERKYSRHRSNFNRLLIFVILSNQVCVALFTD